MEISNGDVFDLHFIKTETVMSIKDKDGKTCNIPLSCPAKFGLFYDPCNDPVRAKRGYTFASVSEIVECKKPPHVMRVTTNFVSGGPLHSVFTNEILILKKVGFGETRNDHYIQVYSLLSSK